MSLKQEQRGSHHLIILLIIIVVCVVAFVGYRVVQKNQDENKQSGKHSNAATSDEDSQFLQQYGSACQDRDVEFTSAPMNEDQLAYIRPLGAVSDGHVTPTDHVYIGPPNPQAADNTYPVLMPADGAIVEVGAMPAQYIGDRKNTTVASEDHRMVISHSCRYFSIYIHIHKLSEAVRSAIGDLQPNESKRTNIELKAGDTVGYIGGSTFDWTPIDTQSTLKGFITPSLYNGEPWKIHTVSPFDLYTGSLKSRLEAKSLRTKSPIGGKIDYDKRGALIGTWFREGSGGYSGGDMKDGAGRYWDGHLSVAPDYIDPDSTIVSIGNWEGSARQFLVKGTADPSRVSQADGMVKYELVRLNYVDGSNNAWNGNALAKGIHPSQSGSVEGTIGFQVLKGEKLKVEKFAGKRASQVTSFSDAAQVYDR